MNEENRAAEQETEKRLSPEEAARAGDLATLRYWIEERGFDVNPKKDDYSPILYDAIKGQDLATVRYLVEEAGAQVEGGADYVPLVRAALDGAWEIVRYLVEERRVSVEETDDHWGTILHVAARTGDLALTKSVVEKYDAAKLIKYETFVGETPIFYAVESGALDVVRYLVELGSDVNLELDLHYPESCSSDHKRLTHVAAENGFLDVLRYLIEEAGADPGPYSWHYEKGTPPSLALENRRWETARYLLNEVGWPVERWEINGAARGGDLTVFKECLAKRPDYLADWENDEYKRSDIVEALSAAIKVDALDIVRYLIEERGVDVGIKGWYDETPVLGAARANKPEILRYLVERGADVNAANSFGETALQLATSANALEIVRFLVKSGADVASLDKGNFKAWHIAARFGKTGALRFGFELGADVDAKDEKGKTALHLAAERDNSVTVLTLLELGADFTAKDAAGKTPRECVKDGPWKLTKFFLVAANGDEPKALRGQALIRAIKRCFIYRDEWANMLLEKGNVDLNATDRDGDTALHAAASSFHDSGESWIKWLLEAGADPTRLNRKGETPLEVARRREHRDALEAPTRERLRAKRLARAERKRKEKR